MIINNLLIKWWLLYYNLQQVEIREENENDFIGREDDTPNPKFITIATGGASKNGYMIHIFYM